MNTINEQRTVKYFTYNKKSRSGYSTSACPISGTLMPKTDIYNYKRGGKRKIYFSFLTERSNFKVLTKSGSYIFTLRPLSFPLSSSQGH